MKRIHYLKQWLLIVFLFAFNLIGYSQPAGWLHYQTFTVTENSGAQVIDYQLKLTVNTLDLISAGQMDVTGKDIRFGKDLAGSVLYNYWIESGLNTANTIIWVKMDTLYANGTRNLYWFYGNPAATAVSGVSGTFFGPNSSTDSVAITSTNTISNCQRGFRFSSSQDLLVTDFGKRIPNATIRYVTLFNYTTTAIVAQMQVSAGTIGSYNYDPLNQPLWLSKDSSYLLELHNESGDMYYYGTSSQIGQYLTYYDMRYCNTCDQNTFPTSVLTDRHYGIPDLLYWSKTEVDPAPTYTLITPNYALLLPTPGVNTNYVSIPYNAAMVGFSNITIEAWVKVGGTGTANTVLNKGAGSFDYQLGISTGGVPFFRHGGTIATSTGLTITAGVWTHLAVTFDGTDALFYKDGLLVCSIPSAGTLGSSTNEMRIGRGNNDPGSGDIEELRLWTVARSGTDIDNDKCKKYPSTFTSTTGLLALWHMDNSLIDSISSFNGSINGTISYDMFDFPDPSMACTGVGIISDDVSENQLLNSFPNPFDKVTTISYQLASKTNVLLKVYDIMGKEVCTLVNARQDKGSYEVNFNAENLNSGIYFYTLTTNGYTQTKSMMLSK